MRIVSLFMAAICFLASCATNPGAKIAKYQIKTVAVEPRVNAAQLRWGELLHNNQDSDLAQSILDSLKSKSMKQMAALMENNNIDLPSMVYSNFVQAVQNLGYAYSTNSTDATFVLDMEQHGFDQRTTFSNVKVPFMVLHGRLIALDGKVLWRGESQTCKDQFFGRDANYLDKRRKQVGVSNWEEYDRDPEKLRRDWDLVIEAAIQDLLRAAKRPTGN